MTFEGAEKGPVNSEYKEIMTRLGSIEVQNARVEQLLDNSHKAFRSFEIDMKKIVERFDHDLNGNGGIGIKKDVDRLKIESDNRKWNLRTLWVTTSALLLKFLFDITIGGRS